MSHFTVAVFVDHSRNKTLEELLAPYQENNMGDVPWQYLEFVEDRDCKLDDKSGREGYWENPNAKWDWWTIGGRWSNSLITKDGVKCDNEWVKNIDWKLIEKEKIRKAENNYQEALIEKNLFIKVKIYGLEKNMTKEEYINKHKTFQTYAIVTPDGKWHQKGEMGWFGCSSETQEEADDWDAKYKERFIDTADSEWEIVIVDCHI